MDEKPLYLERAKSKLLQAKNVKDVVEIKLLNEKFVIYPNVFNPDIFFGTEFLAQELCKIVRDFDKKRPSFLEIGCGAGYMTILAIQNGACKAIGTDINIHAVTNAKMNVEKYNLNDKITIKHGEVFDDVNENEKFDIIFWNFPFSHINQSVNELDLLDRAVFDPFYTSLNIYLQKASSYLQTDGGRLFMGFSAASGNLEVFQQIADRHKWRVHLRNEIQSNADPPMQIGMYELRKIE